MAGLSPPYAGPSLRLLVVVAVPAFSTAGWGPMVNASSPIVFRRIDSAQPQRPPATAAKIATVEADEAGTTVFAVSITADGAGSPQLEDFLQAGTTNARRRFRNDDIFHVLRLDQSLEKEDEGLLSWVTTNRVINNL